MARGVVKIKKHLAVRFGELKVSVPGGTRDFCGFRSVSRAPPGRVLPLTRQRSAEVVLDDSFENLKFIGEVAERPGLLGGLDARLLVIDNRRIRSNLLHHVIQIGADMHVKALEGFGGDDVVAFHAIPFQTTRASVFQGRKSLGTPLELLVTNDETANVVFMRDQN